MLHTPPSRTSTRRVAVILLLGGIIIAVAFGYRRSHLPPSAPSDVQMSGRQIVRSELAKIADSDFGRSERGRVLINEVTRLLKEDRIVFSSGLGGPRGLTWHNLFGAKRVYIKTLEMNHGKYLHQLPWQLSEALFHEAVHSLQGGFHGNSIEEECDAFAAGACAEAVSRCVAPAAVLKMDGMPIGEFVQRSYPGTARNPRYRPIGESLERLKQHTGLH